MIKENIKKLLESDLTAYQISKKTGIQQSTLSRLKKGEIEVGNMKLDNALKLNQIWEEHNHERKVSRDHEGNKNTRT